MKLVFTLNFHNTAEKKVKRVFPFHDKKISLKKSPILNAIIQKQEGKEGYS